MAPINTDANEGEKAGSKVPIAEERQQPHEPSPPSEALNQKPGERAGDEDDEWLVEPDDPDIGKSEDMEAKLGGLRPIGPAMPPGMAASHGAFPEEENTGTAEEAGHGEHARPGRVGPVMPSREMLEAAARAAEAYDWEEEAEEEVIEPPTPYPPFLRHLQYCRENGGAVRQRGIRQRGRGCHGKTADMMVWMILGKFNSRRVTGWERS